MGSRDNNRISSHYNASHFRGNVISSNSALGRRAVYSGRGFVNRGRGVVNRGSGAANRGNRGRGVVNRGIGGLPRGRSVVHRDLEYVPNGRLVSGSVKQGKSRKAPLTSDNGNRSKFSGGNDNDFFSHSANVCGFTSPVTSTAWCGNVLSSRSAEVVSTRRTGRDLPKFSLRSNPYYPLARNKCYNSGTNSSRSIQPQSRYVVDKRMLPLPEPYDKHQPHPSRNQRHRDSWTWDAWRDWLYETWGRKWRKPSIRRVINLRAQDPANQAMDWANVDDLWKLEGWIYGLFHLASGRWYVGQTVRQIHVRGQEHWYQGKRSTDVLHAALGNELSPFSFIIIPLEKISSDLYRCHRWEDTKRRFRLFATPREKYWVGRLNSLWPHGFNSAYPGHPRVCMGETDLENCY